MTKIYHIEDAAMKPEYRRVVFESDHKTLGETVQDAVARKASLRKADLRGADLRNLNLSGGLFNESVMICAMMNGSDLSGCDFSMADLSAVDVTGCNLARVMISSAARTDGIMMDPGTCILSLWFGCSMLISKHCISIGSTTGITVDDLELMDRDALIDIGGEMLADRIDSVIDIAMIILGVTE